VLQITAGSPLVLNYLGAVALEQKKDSSAAADYFARALKAGSNEPMTYLNLAVALQNKGRQEDAEAVLEKGVTMYPFNAPFGRADGDSVCDRRKKLASLRDDPQIPRDLPEDSTVREALDKIGNSTILNPGADRQGSSGIISR
jgi:tetratricopeptide (TPR) repeat protein